MHCRDAGDGPTTDEDAELTYEICNVALNQISEIVIGRQNRSGKDERTSGDKVEYLVEGGRVLAHTASHHVIWHVSNNENQVLPFEDH